MPRTMLRGSRRLLWGVGEEISDTDSGESINRLTEDVKQTEDLVRSVKGSSSRKAGVEIQAYNHGRPGTREQVQCLVDSGVRKP